MVVLCACERRRESERGRESERERVAVATAVKAYKRRGKEIISRGPRQIGWALEIPKRERERQREEKETRENK